MKSLKKTYQQTIPQNIRAKMHVFFFKIRAVFVIGNKVECNCCNSNFSRFLDFGDYKKRKNAICPNCLSLERTRMLWLFLKDSKYLKEKTILQFAPFKVIEKKIKQISSVKYISGDIDPTLAMKKIDITEIDYNKNSFDVILCSHVLSVVKNDKKAIKELYRVLKPNGTLILQTYIFKKYEKTFEDFNIKTNDERYKAYGKHYLQRCYGKDFTERFLKEGFSVDIYDPKKFFTVNEIKKYGIQNSGVIYLFTK
ncbi:methyltransferase domain-containing protein [Polaribacter undariae]|uniref:Methyltransferase domain-containing protein n=3 Tax=Polaribacter sejongensis TaxID=985043 RepID=A0AAJ1VGR6_9FLAO|nr:class I SAM-dependent methyltransferase [Polaribacter undariae]MDN3619916.1 methyltransferase domain-containing protein [Polaribacter undariae]UWD31678.1 class I SAM-dependent methyltransferase [Polaribacter undariae]